MLIMPWDWVISICLAIKQEGFVKGPTLMVGMWTLWFMEKGDQQKESFHSSMRRLCKNGKYFVFWKEEQNKGVCEGYRFWFFIFIFIFIFIFLAFTSPLQLQQFILFLYKILLGSKKLKVYQNPFTMSPFSIDFTSSSFLPCKDTFMDEYDGIYNCNGLIYGSYEIFDTF